MMPSTAQDLVRLVAEEARSAQPNAPVRLEPVRSARPARLDRVRLGFGLALRRLADRIEPACRPAPTMTADARR